MKSGVLKKTAALAVSLLLLLPVCAHAAAGAYTVRSGDSLWKIAVKYQIGLSELIEANPQIQNPSLIYVGQIVSIPNLDDIKALENEVIRLVNVERAKYGLSALKQNWELCRVARYKSQDMIKNNYFAHQSPVYGSAFTMMTNFGIKYTAAAENIAYGQKSAQAVVNAWMSSEGHRSNILSGSYDRIGVGAAKASNGTLYWTQLFIRAAG
jgi:uncharacterized YkwD family protein/spore coat assembly protein SafA